MSYTSLEEGVQTSAPVECYKFIGSFRNYYYTSADRAVTIAGQVYDPVPVTRSRVKSGTHKDDSLMLDLQLPFDVQVVQDYAFAQTPPTLTVEVYRQQIDDLTGLSYILFWKGVVRGYTVDDRLATVHVPSIFSLALQGEVPNVYYQTPCNHTLYNNRCTVVRTSHRFTGLILTVNSTDIVMAATPAADSILKAGEIVNLRNGERRMILENIGPIITLGYPFVDLVVGDSVELVKGCDHSLATCKAKFSNVINFGGFKYIPAENPFEGSVA